MCSKEKLLVVVVVVVIVVMTSPSGAACMWGQMSRRDEEFHQTLVVLEHICDVSRIRTIVNVQPSRPHYHNVDRLDSVNRADCNWSGKDSKNVCMLYTFLRAYFCTVIWLNVLGSAGVSWQRV